MKNCIIIIFLAFFLALPFINAQETLGTFKQGECINLIQTCSDCTYINISSISLPDSSVILLEMPMTKQGILYNYTFCNTSLLGNYIVAGHGDAEGKDTAWVYDFYITPSGKERLTDGESQSLSTSIWTMLITAIFFLIVSFRFENIGMKIILGGLSAIIILAIILYSLVIMNDMGLSQNIIEGFSTFWFVIKILFGIALIGLLIFTLWSSWMLWMKKRGMRD